jgi:hypothetical protein
MQTRLGRYSIALQEHSDGSFAIREYKHCSETGCFSMGPADYFTALAEYNRRIDDAMRYDGIAYTRAVR